MRQCEFKRKYDPDLDTHVRKHISGEGVGDIFKSIGKKLFSKTAKTAMKGIAKKAATTAAEKAATKTGEFVGNKAGDKIIKLLSKDRRTRVPPTMTDVERAPMPIMRSDQETNDLVNRILSGGRLRRRNLI